MAADSPVAGECDARFAPVREEFERNFTERGDIGGAVAVFWQGKNVVDLWGGHRDRERTKPWREDTIAMTYSIGKSMLATGVHMLADRGIIDLEAPVARYWPEFAQGGKQDIKVRHVVSHHCGVIFNDAAKAGDILDYDAMIHALAVQEPAWPAGTKGAYNSINYGYLNAEIIRRATGKPGPRFLQDELWGPLGVDFYGIGLDDAAIARCATVYPPPAANAQLAAGSATNVQTNATRAWNAVPKPYNAEVISSTAFRKAPVMSFGGHGTARGIARVYAMLANNGEFGGRRYLSAAAVERAQTEQWSEDQDGVYLRPYRMAMGYFKNKPGWVPMGPNPEAFGHHGLGGPLAFADRDRNLAFCALSNYQAAGASVGERTEALVDATFRCV